MILLKFGREQADPIARFGSVRASSSALGSGTGPTHVYSVYLDQNSEIGPHPTGFCQLFLVVNGSGWVASENGERVEVVAGEGAYFEKGELHSKGSVSGMHAIMVQVDEMHSPEDPAG